MAHPTDMNPQNGQSLQRFIDAQESSYATALSEIKSGRKKSHWMWYIFPQIQGLGSSDMARYYAIAGMGEATRFLQHPVLGKRLTEISTVLLGLATDNASEIFGYPDDLKLKSSLTLFAAVPAADPVFQKLLGKFFGGKQDETTLAIIRSK